MFHYQQILFLMRSGESDRDLARAGIVGRRKAAEVRKQAITSVNQEFPSNPGIIHFSCFNSAR